MINYRSIPDNWLLSCEQGTDETFEFLFVKDATFNCFIPDNLISQIRLFLLTLDVVLTSSYRFICVAEALELISTAANHSNAAIRKMVRLSAALNVTVLVFFSSLL